MMNLSEDLCKFQGLLTSIHTNVGNFSSIRYPEGNEEKIKKITQELQNWLYRKKYVRNEVINHKRENNIRRVVMFIILNTDFANKKEFSIKANHLIGIIPQFSKFFLTHLVLNVGLYPFYAEAITSLPPEISLELLEYCGKHIKKVEPYAILKITSSISQAIYLKIYHMRYETTEKIDNISIKLLNKFFSILKNYVTPVTEKLMDWPTVKMYQYMGRAIYEILNLLKTCLSVYNMQEYVAPYYQFYQFTPEISHPLVESQIALNKSISILKECNKNLISMCEANISAVSVDVYCSWVECKYGSVTLQQAIRTLAYEVIERLKLVEDAGDLPQMLGSIAISPQPIEEIIQSADETTLLENVLIVNENQPKWYKALLNYGILHSEQTFDIFKSIIHLSDIEDYVNLLNLCNSDIKHEFALKKLLLENLHNMSETDSITIIAEYFKKNGINNIYETENFQLKLTEFFNKLNCANRDEILLKDISILVLQNPLKFITNLIEESEKNIEHLSNIVHIFVFIKPICLLTLPNKENNIFYNLIKQKLEEVNLTPKTEKCMIKFITELISQEVLSTKLLNDCLIIYNDCLRNNDLKRASFICRLYKELCMFSKKDLIPTILQFAFSMSKIRWNFFTYSEEKRILITDIIQVIYHLKLNLPLNLNDKLIKAAETVENKLDSYHVVRNLKNNTNNFLTHINSKSGITNNHNKQVCLIIKILPSCVPLEWELIADNLIDKKSPLEVLKIFIDVLLVLTEMSKKSTDNHLSLSYCFQQFCIITKDVIHSHIKQKKNLEVMFIKNICRLITHLPKELHNTVELSLINLFNFDVLRSLKDDKDFLLQLTLMSELEICKIICSKMTS